MNDNLNCRIFPSIFLAILLSFPVVADEVGPADIFQAASELASEIEQVRIVLGRPKIPAYRYVLENTEARHVYYVEQTTFHRANHLAQKLSGAKSRSLPPAPEGPISPVALLEGMRQIQGQIQLVKRGLEIDAPAIGATRDPSKDLNQVLLVLGDVGRQLNVLLGRTVEWSALYDRVQVALAYVAGALPENQRYPSLPPLQSGKFASDIFARIEECRHVARKTATKFGVNILGSSVVDRSQVLPNLTEAEVYDLITVTLTDLAVLTLAMKAKDADRPPYPRPRNVTPSHVYQLTGALRKQLELLAEL